MKLCPVTILWARTNTESKITAKNSYEYFFNNKPVSNRFYLSFFIIKYGQFNIGMTQESKLKYLLILKYLIFYKNFKLSMF